MVFTPSNKKSVNNKEEKSIKNRATNIRAFVQLFIILGTIFALLYLVSEYKIMIIIQI
jgi:flagellar biogenesis protein FliO